MKLRDLPPEILGLTLQTLPQPDLYQCIFVNRRFNAAAMPHLWRAPLIHNHQRFKQFVRCVRASKKPVGSWVRQFKVAWEGFDDDDCLLLLPHIPQLEDFTIHHSDYLTDKSISHPYPCCHTAYDMRAFRRLRHLDIVCSDKNAMMNDFLVALSKDDRSRIVMPELESFSVTGCNEIGDTAAIRFITTHPRLEYLTLMACGITDATLDAVQHYLPRLVYLDISFCESVTMAGVRRLIRASKLQM
ncbi:hypothetical protein BJV82DRAFT_498771, partial [Fennellomyces sp. T-0311]